MAKSSVICSNSKPSLLPALVCIQFGDHDLLECQYCTGTYMKSDIFSCSICSNFFCSDCINAEAVDQKIKLHWVHSSEKCHQLCDTIPMDRHSYNFVCSFECQKQFLSLFSPDKLSNKSFLSVEGNPSEISHCFTEPNSFIFSYSEDDTDSYFSRVKTPQACYTDSSYFQDIFADKHHSSHKTECHYLCTDCSQMYASSYMLKCDSCSHTFLCHKCVTIRMIYLESRFIHLMDWCSGCEQKYDIQRCDSITRDVHAMFFVCSPECIEAFYTSHKTTSTSK